MAKKSIFILFTFFTLCYTSVVRAQYSGDYEYSVEKVWGVTKATNSGLIGGFMFKYARELKKDRFHGGMIEIVNIKHPQEQRIYANSTGNTYIWGKQNHLYSIRLSYLRQFTLFKKASQQGVQVSGIVAVGPTIGLEAPYYVEVESGRGSIRVPYDPDEYQYNEILGTGKILQGVGESSIVPGLNTKAAVAFEFGAFKSNVVGLEVGFQSDFFTRKIIIMPTSENYSIFPSAYVTLFYGSRR
jgi:hypothetical protein